MFGKCRQREDAVRMIMQGLLGDDGSNDLAAELAKRQEPNDGLSCNESATKCPEDWLPDPREADPSQCYMIFYTVGRRLSWSVTHHITINKTVAP